MLLKYAFIRKHVDSKYVGSRSRPVKLAAKNPRQLAVGKDSDVVQQRQQQQTVAACVLFRNVSEVVGLVVCCNRPHT